MRTTIIKISSLLLAIGIMLAGSGLQGTLIALRGVEEQFSEEIIGAIMSMYFFGFITGAFICPGIIQRVRHIRTFCMMAALCSCAIILMGLWPNPLVWGSMRFFLGVCIIGIYMVTESWLNSQATNANRGGIFSVYTLINLLFLTVGQCLILAGDIKSMDLFAIAAALFSFSLVPVALTRIEEPPPVSRIKPDLRHLYRISSLGFMSSFTAGVLCGLFWSLGPLFAGLSGLSEFGIVMFMTSTIVGGIVFLWPIGHWSDRRDRRLVMAIVSFVSVLAAACAILAPADTYLWLSICMLVYGGMIFAIYPLSVAHTNDLADTEDRFNVISNLLLTYGAGAAIGPLIGGVLMDLLGRYSLFGLFILGGLFLGGYAIYWRRHVPEPGAEEKTLYAPFVRTTQAAVELELPHDEPAAADADRDSPD